jgi:hypothetical protein
VSNVAANRSHRIRRRAPADVPVQLSRSRRMEHRRLRPLSPQHGARHRRLEVRIRAGRRAAGREPRRGVVRQHRLRRVGQLLRLELLVRRRDALATRNSHPTTGVAARGVTARHTDIRDQELHRPVARHTARVSVPARHRAANARDPRTSTQRRLPHPHRRRAPALVCRRRRAAGRDREPARQEIAPDEPQVAIVVRSTGLAVLRGLKLAVRREEPAAASRSEVRRARRCDSPPIVFSSASSSGSKPPSRTNSMTSLTSCRRYARVPPAPHRRRRRRRVKAVTGAARPHNHERPRRDGPLSLGHARLRS